MSAGTLTSSEALRDIRRKLNPAPRLRVHRSPITHRWLWHVYDRGGVLQAWSEARTHHEALAVGLAALEVASVGRPAD